MNKDIFISVIIPVYKAQKTAGICLKSELDSEYKDFEAVNEKQFINSFTEEIIRTYNIFCQKLEFLS